jgi:energy-coupling factor transporter ATP-binding protein EcfA2
MAFQEAKREQIWLKVLLAGASGSGKTYSALRLATGIAKKTKGKIAAIDTENGRIRYYADEFKFNDQRITSPFEPEKYVSIIEEAVDAGFSVLIIDSITHEWDYCLEVHSKMPGNSYTNWAKITPRHDAFMEKVLQAPIHIIATVRGKDEYVLESKDGKQVPQKVGLGYKQRDNTEYNYTVTFNIDQKTHIADVMKDNTHLFEGRYEMLTEKDGEKLYGWANEGIKAEPLPPKGESKQQQENKDDDIATVKKDIVAFMQNNGGRENETLMNILKEYNKSGNPNAIKDLDKAKECYKKLQDAVKPEENE